MTEPLNLKLTAEARARAVAFLQGIKDYSPTLCLMKELSGRWHFGAYADSNLAALEPDLRRQGHPLLYVVDGMVVAIPQFHLLSELVGKTLAVGPKGLVVVEREPGA